MQHKPPQMVEGARMPPFRDSAVPIIYYGGEPVPPTKPVAMQKLRERGIYALADGRAFVAHAVFRGGYVFYTVDDWDNFGPYSYESDSQGRVRWNDNGAHWRTEDLIDTSRTARSRSRETA
jgi:hypothetical protein